MIFIGILFGILGLLLQWWINRSASGRSPSARHVQNTEKLIGYVEKIKAVAVPMGVNPRGIDPDTPDVPEDFEADTVDEFGNIITDQFYKMIAARFIVPLLAKRLQDLPGIAVEELVNTGKWEEWMVKQIKDSQSQ